MHSSSFLRGEGVGWLNWNEDAVNNIQLNTLGRREPSNKHRFAIARFNAHSFFSPTLSLFRSLYLPLRNSCSSLALLFHNICFLRCWSAMLTDGTNRVCCRFSACIVCILTRLVPCVYNMDMQGCNMHGTWVCRYQIGIHSHVQCVVRACSTFLSCSVYQKRAYSRAQCVFLRFFLPAACKTLV